MEITCNSPQTVIVIDDDEAIRDSLKLLMASVGYKVIGFPSAQAYLEQHHRAHRGCMILDIRMPGMSGLELQRKLNRMGSQVQIIFITGHGDVQMAVQAMKRGAVDFLEKPFRDQDLIDKVNRAFQRIRDIEENIKQQSLLNKRLHSLTTREKEVLEHILQGGANKAIAIDLGISIRTVEVHRAKLMKKMGAKGKQSDMIRHR